VFQRSRWQAFPAIPGSCQTGEISDISVSLELMQIVHAKRRFAAGLAFLSASLAFGHPSTTTNLSAVAPPTDPASARKVLNQYCGYCHNQKLKTAGVMFDTLDTAKIGPDAATWERVLRKVNAGEMPPPKLPRPNPQTITSFTVWLRGELDKEAALHPNPGHPTIHRLNRAEYSNAIRDLLALNIEPGEKLPVDDSGYGFDNIADVLSLSPMLIERYMSVARLVARSAVGDVSVKPETNLYAIGKATRKGRVSDDLPFDSSGGLSISYDFPVDGEYIFKMKTPASVLVSAEGFPADPHLFEVRIPVKAGVHTVGVTFQAENGLAESVVVPSRRPAAGAPAPPTIAKMDLRLDGARLKLFDVPHLGSTPQLTSLMISGPYNVTGPGVTPSRNKIFVCTAKNAREEDPCARKILANLARYAYRRPVTDADLTPLLAFYRRGRQAGSFDSSFDKGIERALQAMLVSPDFLFRIERDPASAVPGTVHRVNDFELASRLSFFLWSSIPDDELLKLAAQEKLCEPAVLSAQVARMLADPKSKAFVSNFAGQWLYLRNLAQVRPDPDMFPDYDPSLRDAFQRETELFVAAIIRENRPVTDLLSANFTYMNQELARHYGISDVYGSQFRRVVLTNENRGGLLGQGSILTVTSYPNRTSVVQRGKWVLENLLGSPPPPPPANVPPLEAHSKDGKELTARQQMEQHRANPVCASCHARMDPIGFALENYNGVGVWRDKDAGSKIDPSGTLSDGTTFQGPAGLRQLLLTKLRGEFLETFTEKLMTYALGRGLEYYDKPAVRSIAAEADHQNDTITAFIQAIVKSQQFQMRRTS
jgi:mono/diheme cytochrome c family protein